MQFSTFAKYLDRLEKTSSRIEITKILAALFAESSKDEIDKVVNLSLGQLAPTYESVIFNIAERVMINVLARAYKKDKSEVVNLYKKEGDIGNVAEKLAKKKKNSISVTEVYSKLFKIANDNGEGSQERKVAKTAELISSLDSLSARFLARIPVGHLRLGFSEKTIIDALSWMEKGDKTDKTRLERAYEVKPNIGLLVRLVKEKGIDKAIENPIPEFGIPISPMLAQRLKNPDEMIKKMKKVAIEPKLDGLRLQIHFKKGKEACAFTRNLNEISWMFPELDDLGKEIKAQEIILDSEAIGLDETEKTMANFQTTMTRRRKYEIEERRTKVPIKFYLFDVLLVDGKNMMAKDYLERRKALQKAIKGGKFLRVIESEISQSADKIREENKKKRSEGYEGIMLKKVESGYIPGRTGWRWVKMKESESSAGKLADTVDLIVMGYTAGRGKRAGFGIGQFLVGVRDGDRVKTTTKVGTGLTDEQFKELAKRLKSLEVSKKPKEYEVNKPLEPDYWVTPSVVVEIAADDITKSPTHTAGIALRFPRLISFRGDKSPKEATTLSELEKLAKLQ
ncbi:ATP-dependent DNA ligase [Patescibacteria group bacterium]|nr:ATP-dependent DNA ligase [Patescibacteria group bacterium]